jgi:hypothetical protein
VSWRRAESAGDDVTLVFDGQTCGFFTEISTGCFADAQAWPSLRARFEEDAAARGPEAEEDPWFGSGSTTKVTDEAAGADLVAFATTGDGGYPVWLGLDESGQVACVALKVDDLPDLTVL